MYKPVWGIIAEKVGVFNPIRPGEGGGGGVGSKCPCQFELSRNSLILSNTYHMRTLLLKFIGAQDSGKKGYHVYSNFDFLNIFLH